MRDCKHVPAAGKVTSARGDHCSLPRVRVSQLLLGVTTRVLVCYLDGKVVLQPPFRDGLVQRGR